MGLSGPDVAAAVAAAGEANPSLAWSICVIDLDSQSQISHRPGARLRTASIGKLILLAEVARRIELNPAYGDRVLPTGDVESVADSGVLQHLSAVSLNVHDLAALVGYASDNWATNVLLADVGLAAVAETGHRLGLRQTELLDRVRRPRTAEDPEALSCGSAAELAGFMTRLQRGDLLTTAVAARLNRWLEPGVDLSMVASAFGFDPLSHAEDDRGLRLVNKTGTDSGVRADVGYVEGPGGRAAYAVLANWPRDGVDQRDVVLGHMRQIGRAIRAGVEQA
jgi:beta-lactamase class A